MEWPWGRTEQLPSWASVRAAQGSCRLRRNTLAGPCCPQGQSRLGSAEGVVCVWSVLYFPRFTLNKVAKPRSACWRGLGLTVGFWRPHCYHTASSTSDSRMFRPALLPLPGLLALAFLAGESHGTGPFLGWCGEALRATAQSLVPAERLTGRHLLFTCLSTASRHLSHFQNVLGAGMVLKNTHMGAVGPATCSPSGTQSATSCVAMCGCPAAPGAPGALAAPMCPSCPVCACCPCVAALLPPTHRSDSHSHSSLGAGSLALEPG